MLTVVTPMREKIDNNSFDVNVGTEEAISMNINDYQSHIKVITNKISQSHKYLTKIKHSVNLFSIGGNCKAGINEKHVLKLIDKEFDCVNAILENVQSKCDETIKQNQENIEEKRVSLEKTWQNWDVADMLSWFGYIFALRKLKNINIGCKDIVMMAKLIMMLTLMQTQIQHR